MGRKLSGMEPTPFVSIRDKVGSTFVGTLIGGPREVPLKKGKGYIYDFKAEGGTAPIKIKQDGVVSEATVAKGDLVAVFAPTVLYKALLKATAGMRIQITYIGFPDNKYHNFDVEVL